MDSEDVIHRSDQLDDRIAGSTDIQALVKSSRRTKRVILGLTISVALDILLSIALGILAFRANNLAVEANSIEEHVYATCVAGNETRAGQLQLWHYLLDLPPATPRTPAQQEQADQFGRYIDELFAPKKC